MKVFGTGLHKDPWISGIFFRGGDICHPWDGQWFGPIWPTRFWRTFCRFAILPFISIRIWRFGFYIGFKMYGADVIPAYLNWMYIEDVYDGSNALHMSMRITANHPHWRK